MNRPYFSIHDNGNGDNFVLWAHNGKSAVGIFKIGCRARLHNNGWTWVHGVGTCGVWVTKDYSIAADVANRLGIKIKHLDTEKLNAAGL